MIIDCVADLHGYYPELEGGDLLIVAGDLTARHAKKEFTEFGEWYHAQDYKKKILVAGNHDVLIETGDYYFNHDWMGYLCDSGTEFEFEQEIEEEHKFKGPISYKVKRKLKIWGSPWSLWFDGINPACKAFTGSEKDLEKKYALIPDDIDILITHSPPYGILDGIPLEDGTLFHVGSKSLENRVFFMTSLQLHIFGHIHENGGRIIERTSDCSCNHISINASIVNENYEHVNKPIRIEI